MPADAETEDSSSEESNEETSGDGTQAPPPPNGGQSMTSMPTSALAQLKSRERAKGKREASIVYEQRLEKMAKLMGFASIDEMENVDPEAWRKKQQAAAQPPKPQAGKAKPKPTATSRSRDLEQENARLLEEKRRLNKLSAVGARRLKQLEREKAAMEAETELRIAATRAGVVDVEYALHLLRKEMRTLPPEEIAAFDEDVFFGETLRRNAPYLYTTETVPATTGIDTSGADKTKAPPPPKVKDETVPNGKTDAAKMTRDEYLAMLKSKGLTDPSVGMPS